MKDLSLYFRSRLVQAWDDHSAGSAAVDDDLYVQWSAQPAGLQIECVSNRYLPEDRQLTFQQRRRLQDAGWQSPAGDDLPNYWQRFTDRAMLQSAVDALVDAVDVLRLGLPSSEPAPNAGRLPPVPTPKPARRRRPSSERRTTVVVPVYKGAGQLASWAAQALVAHRAGPVTVVDLLGVDDDLPEGRRVGGLGGAGLHTGEAVVVARPKEPLGSDLAGWLRASADLLPLVEAAAARGRDVVVIAPWLLDRDPWLYAGVVGELADELVLCIADDGQGYAEDVALPLLDATGAPRPVVLLGHHADQVGRVTGRARAVLHVGDEDAYASPVTRSAFLALADGGKAADPEVAELVTQARAGPLWARFHLLMSGRLPEYEHVHAALRLLEDVALIVKGSASGPFREAVVGLLGPLVLRLGYWVPADSETARRRVPVVAADLLQLDADCAALGKDLLAVYGHQPSDDRGAGSRGRGGRHDDETTERVEAQMHYVPAGTTCRSKAELAQVLESWLRHEDRETTIGEPSSFGGKALVHVELAGQRFHLNGDSRDSGVQAYLDLVRQHGAELPWHVVANANGKVNKVAFGEPPTAVQYLYLYASEQAQAPYTV